MNVGRVLLVAMLVAACSSGGGPTATTQPTDSLSAPPSTAASPAAGEIDAEMVTVGSALAQIRGHHQASLELFAADDMDGVLAHASHPVDRDHRLHPK